MSLFIFLTVVQAIVAFLLIVVILMQKSEGGGLGVGGSPAGLMSARGAADFLLAALAASNGSDRRIEDSLNRSTAPVQQAPANPLGGVASPAAPAGADPLSAPAPKQ